MIDFGHTLPVVAQLLLCVGGGEINLSQDRRWILAIGPQGVKPESIHSR